MGRPATFPTILEALESFLEHTADYGWSPGRATAHAAVFLAGARAALVVLAHHEEDGADAVEAAYRRLDADITAAFREIEAAIGGR